MASRLATGFKELMLGACREVPEGATVFLSGGVDSSIVLFALIELGKEPRAAAFMLDGHMSTDFSVARQTARRLDVPFSSLFLPTDLDALVEDIRILIRDYGLRGKADIECAWPRLHMMREHGRGPVATGDGADGYFGVSRKACVEYKDRMDEWRELYFGRDNPAQTRTIREMSANYGGSVCFPWMGSTMWDWFRGRTWDECNRPRQKEIAVAPYQDWFDRAQMKPQPHVNLQLGDSRISALFASLVDTRHNTRGSRAVIGIMNDLIREEERDDAR